ncbi:MAG: 4Fe-4S dicluster domain-containing protein [Candidatus Eisenbacteria bacterium]|nr:4Fe-4S dicluster domain-containing protein [Candidatus Eisenbacteria bacterium]
MSISRRRFLGLTAGALAGSAVPAEASQDRHGIDDEKAYGVLVDTVICIGCRKCEWACNDEHGLSDRPLTEYEDKSVFADNRRPHAKAYTVVNQFSDPAKEGEAGRRWIKVQCMHCNRPACVSACIVGAFRKDPSGPVVYDAWKCIGCRYCMVACPFQIPAYEYERAVEPRVMKCSFCADRLQEGKRPACVAICPNEALTFGTRAELFQVAHERFMAHPDRYLHHIYGEHEAGGTSWMYLVPCDFEHTELPALSETPPPDRTEPIQHGIFKGFVPPLALYGLLGLAMYVQRQKRQGEGEGDERA